MTITTTEHIEGRTITEYLGIVSAANIMVLPGGNKMVNRGWQNGMTEALATLEEQARALGADAVVGAQFRPFGSSLCATGTAVRLA